jgi:ABC-type phosphate transport system auxiliary subunit
LLDDPEQRIQTSVMFALTSGGFTSALPKLEQQVAKIRGRARQMLVAQIEAMKNKKKDPVIATDTSAKEAGDLERQAADLELQAKELRNRAEALKLKAERSKLSTSKPSP